MTKQKSEQLPRRNPALAQPTKRKPIHESPAQRDIRLGKKPWPDPATENQHPLTTLFERAQLELVTTPAMDAAILHPGEPETRVEPSLRWKGTQRELLELMIELKSTAKLAVKNEADLLRQIARHFVTDDGEPLSPDSLRVNLNGLRALRRGQKK